MTETDRLLSDFIDAWNAGRRPRVQDYLARAPDDARNELAEQLTTFLEYAPTPAYDEATMAELMADPAVVAAAEAFESEAGLWPALLPRLREQARLTLGDVAGRLADALGLVGREAKTEAYLSRMEAGTLDPGGVSRRVLEALGRILRVDPGDLDRAGAFGVAEPAPALLRSDPGTAPSVAHLEVLADALAASAPGEEWDEVDHLFRGGR
jgi:transcriptional regulator with XRE-family HTH domain